MKSQRKVLKQAKEANDKKMVAKEKKKLQKIHDEEMVDFFQQKINSINSSSDSCRHGVAWGAINDITGRKKSATCRLKFWTGAKEQVLRSL